MTALAADSRPRRFENTRSTSRRNAPGPNRSHFSYNTQMQQPKKPARPCKSDTTEPLPTTEKRRRPGRRPGTTSLLMLDDVTKLLSSCKWFWLEVSHNTPVSGPDGPPTRRYAPAAALPCRDHSDSAHQHLNYLVAGYCLSGQGGNWWHLKTQ